MWTIISLLRDNLDKVTDKLGLTNYLLLIIFNIIYFGAIIGIVLINTEYINIFNIIIHSLLCLFLMYRFNPFRRNIEIKYYDQIIIFNTAVFLLINLGIAQYIRKGIDDSKQLFVNDTK